MFGRSQPTGPEDYQVVRASHVPCWVDLRLTDSLVLVRS